MLYLVVLFRFWAFVLEWRKGADEQGRRQKESDGEGFFYLKGRMNVKNRESVSSQVPDSSILRSDGPY